MKAFQKLYKECLIFICQEPGDIYRGDMQLRQAATISQVEHKLPFTTILQNMRYP
jgi:hypothetical protein